MNGERILVAVTDYPDLNGKVALMYVHVRNIYYQECGIEVIVLNFAAKRDYEIDGIRVITLKTYNHQSTNCDILICHAANLRNHYIFLIKHKNDFKKIVFFYHGHEVLKINKTYSKPYNFAKNSIVKAFLQDRYDELKLFLWKRFILKNINKLFLVFVSNWMLEEFIKSTKLQFDSIKNNYMITYNCIGKPFENIVFDFKREKEYDFLTIRANLDGSKYAIDIVNELAKENQDMKFLLYGKGHFFTHFEKASNLTWINATLNHSEIANIMQNCRCSLMPTRTDAQGLMMCELASTGMPLITSDLPVCHEVFCDFDNISFINNNNPKTNLKLILEDLETKVPYMQNKKYYNENTSKQEVDLIKFIIHEGNNNG